jgi:hypothetical protein
MSIWSLTIGAAAVITTGGGQRQAGEGALENGLQRLLQDGEVEVSVPSLGYRSAFIGAVSSRCRAPCSPGQHRHVFA